MDTGAAFKVNNLVALGWYHLFSFLLRLEFDEKTCDVCACCSRILILVCCESDIFSDWL